MGVSVRSASGGWCGRKYNLYEEDWPMGNNGLSQKIYGQLATLKDFIPGDLASGTFINLFHGILDELESLGGVMARFRVPDSTIGTNPQTNEQGCDASMLLEKVEDILNLFTRTRIDEKGIPEFGFSLPESSS
jgi:hypothetical protein